jgi:hypothetical protein
MMITPTRPTLDYSDWGWIAVPVVLAAMPHQHTTEPLNCFDQIEPPHDTTNSSTLRMPGKSPLVRS